MDIKQKISISKKSILYICGIVFVIVIGVYLVNVSGNEIQGQIVEKRETLTDFIKIQENIDKQIQHLIITKDSLNLVFYKKLAIEFAHEFNIDKALLFGLWMQESQMNPKAKGDGGRAHGLGQVHLTTAKGNDSSMTSDKLMEPITNARASALYLRQCLDKNKGNLLKGIACYRLGKDSKSMDWEYAAKVLRYTIEWRD